MGASVSLGADVVISRSVLFDNVTVSSGARIFDSVIDQGVSVLEDAIVEGGSMVGGGARVGKGAKVKSVQVGLRRPEGRKAVEADLGKGGVGEVWGFEREADVGDDEDEEEAKDARNLKLSRLGALPLFITDEELLLSGGTGVSIDDPVLTSSSSSLSSLASVASLESRSSISVAGVSGIGQVGSTGDFLTEAVHSLDRAFVEGVTVDNALLELKTLRMASNVPQSRLRSTVVSYLCTKASEGDKTSAEAVKVVKRWAGLIAGLVGEDELAMADTLVALQRHCAEDPGQARLFPAFLQAFYNDDVVSEEGVVRWFKSPASRETGGEAGLKLRDVGGRFVQALTEAESDPESED